MASRESRAAVGSSPRPGANRGGPAVGWTWRDARRALRFGKQEGASGVVLKRGGETHFLFGARGRRNGRVEPEPPPPDGRREQRDHRAASQASAPTGVLSKRRQKSAERLQEFQQSWRLRHCRLRKVVLRVLRRLRHERVWRVFREWHATRNVSNAAHSAADPALATERMDADGTTRAGDDVEMGASSGAPSSQHRLEGAPLAGSGLDPTAQEFVPGLLLMEVERAWHAAADETTATAAWRMARPEVEWQRRREARRAKRMATAAAKMTEAVDMAMHNAAELLRPPRHASPPLGVQHPQPPPSPG